MSAPLRTPPHAPKEPRSPRLALGTAAVLLVFAVTAAATLAPRVLPTPPAVALAAEPPRARVSGSPEGIALAERMMTAFGDRETWASRVVDHITASVEFGPGETHLVEIFTRWDRPQTLFWVRTRTREQVRVFDGDRGWTATRVYGQEPVVREWTAEQVAQERFQYRAQFERLVHRIAKRDPALSFTVATGDYAGWLEVSEGGVATIRVRVGGDGMPQNFKVVGTAEPPARFDPLVSFGDHKQPSSGSAGGATRFTTYVAELRPTADGIHFGPPRGKDSLDPTR